MKKFSYSHIGAHVSDSSSMETSMDSGDYLATMNSPTNHMSTQTNIQANAQVFVNNRSHTNDYSTSSSEASNSSENDTHLYLFRPDSRGNYENIIISAILYAYVFKSMSEDSLNYILKIFSSWMPPEIPVSVRSLIRKFKKDVMNFFPSHITKRYCSYCDRICTGPSALCSLCKRKVCSFTNLDTMFQLKVIISDYYSIIKDYQRTFNIENGDFDSAGACGNTRCFETVGEMDLHLMICTDGGNPYKTSSCSYWPLLAVVLDLPPNLRYKTENIILLSLWTGPSKPNWQVYLKSFLSEFPFGQRVEINLGNTVLGVTIAIKRAVFDLPAQASILNVKQYNGEFGCLFCVHPGVVEKHARTYPCLSNIENISDSQYLTYVEAAEAAGVPVFGVKGRSVLSDYMSIPSSIALDPLHLFFENITKMILTYMLDSSNRHKANYIGRRIRRIQNLMSEQTVPSDLKKCRDVEHIKFWTGRDFMNFLYFYLIPFIGFGLPKAYNKHLLAFVVGVRLAMCEKAVSYVDEINQLFRYFISEMEVLYTRQQMTINVHLLEHIAGNILNSGSLTYSSMAPFEAHFKTIKRLIKGGKGHFNQVISKFLLLKCTSTYLKASEKSLPSLEHRPIYKLLDLKYDSVESEVEVISRFRVRIRHMIFDYSDSSVDCFCKTKDEIFGKIIDIFYVGSNAYVKMNMCVPLLDCYFGSDIVGKILHTHLPRYMSFVSFSNSIRVLPASDVLCKCVYFRNISFQSTDFSLLCCMSDTYTYT